ncbi:MAG TPA: YfcE family phosphodiesterase [Bryobacteraceae bacterium]|nr:YfcE family phosphodiesterase [Bryobacteraceae bacterium]
MQLGIVSDIHDHLHYLQPAIAYLAERTHVLICCGDLCSPFVMDQLAKYPGPVHIVFGNNDADLFRITRKSNDRVQVHGELAELDLDGFRVGVNHYDNIAAGLARSGLYDLVCYGHNHRFRLQQLGDTVALNPGAIMGAAFAPGGWERIQPTFATFAIGSREAKLYRVDGDQCLPHQFT